MASFGSARIGGGSCPPMEANTRGGWKHVDVQNCIWVTPWLEGNPLDPSEKKLLSPKAGNSTTPSSPGPHPLFHPLLLSPFQGLSTPRRRWHPFLPATVEGREVHLLQDVLSTPRSQVAVSFPSLSLWERRSRKQELSY